jgi:hypothetical protein
VKKFKVGDKVKLDPSAKKQPGCYSNSEVEALLLRRLLFPPWEVTKTRNLNYGGQQVWLNTNPFYFLSFHFRLQESPNERNKRLLKKREE